MGDAKESRGMCGCIISKNGVCEKDGCTDLCSPRHLRRLPHADETLCWEPRSADILCSVIEGGRYEGSSKGARVKGTTCSLDTLSLAS